MVGVVTWSCPAWSGLYGDQETDWDESYSVVVGFLGGVEVELSEFGL